MAASIDQPASCSSRMNRLVSLSSTTRTLRPATDGRGAVVRSVSVAGVNRAVNQNVLPEPDSLLTPISPPITSTIWRLMARPRPVPPYSRVVELSPWENAVNSRSCTSGVMPGPVSLTSTRSTMSVSSTRALLVSSLVSSIARTTTSPLVVNFTALEVRLEMTCPKRTGSPHTAGGTSG